MTEFDEVAGKPMGRPHVVLLGAGASKQAFMEGDRNGRPIPLMEDLAEVVGLSEILTEAGVSTDLSDFEGAYTEIEEMGDERLLSIVKHCVRSYFVRLRLPDRPTLYDHLILSLRKKDLIATFNWDPFLVHAMLRNRHIGNLPRLAFLHGCVSLGICEEHGFRGPQVSRCPQCQEFMKPAPILYPVVHKDYTEHPAIHADWELLKHELIQAYMFTIFGYSAPKTDVKAVALMQEAWGTWQSRKYEQIEMINTEDEATLIETWRPFVHTHHYEYYRDFYESWIARHPRRSCEAKWEQLMELGYPDDRRLPSDADWEELEGWLQPLLSAEATSESTASA